MMLGKYEKEYCMACGKIHSQDQPICECGSRNFVFGNKFSYDRGRGVICDCGNSKFQMIFHMNRSPVYDKTYKCTNCKNLIGIQTYLKNSYDEYGCEVED